MPPEYNASTRASAGGKSRSCDLKIEIPDPRFQIQYSIMGDHSK